MQKELQNFFKEINGGKLRGYQKIIANALNIDVTAVSKWSSGVAKPSEDNIRKMANIFKKSQEELERIFNNNSKVQSYKNRNELDFYKKELVLRDEMIALLKDKIKVLEDKNKSLETKLKNK